MKGSRTLTLLICLAFICLAIIGCSNGQVSQVKVESGVIDTDYSGIPTAHVAQDYKLDNQAKENMIKITIKCGVEKEIPAGDAEGESKQTDEPDEAKPKI